MVGTIYKMHGLAGKNFRLLAFRFTLVTVFIPFPTSRFLLHPSASPIPGSPLPAPRFQLRVVDRRCVSCSLLTAHCSLHFPLLCLSRFSYSRFTVPIPSPLSPQSSVARTTRRKTTPRLPSARPEALSPAPFDYRCQL